MKNKVRLYHFVPERFGISNIENRRLKVSLFKDMNDPFELLAHNCQSAQDRKAFNVYKEHLGERSGIVCFSKSFKSPVQWAHYAERHTGMCLGFDVNKNYARDVRYIKGRINYKSLEFSNEKQLDAFLERISQSKHESWSYEAESRIWGKLTEPDANGMHFLQFNDDVVLKEVLIGARATISRSQVDELLEQFSGQVRAYKVRPAFRTFEMVRNRDESAWR